MTGNHHPLAGCRVLVVEDEYFLADDLHRALTSCGAEVLGPYGTLDEAMGQVEEDGFEVAVLDLNLREEMAYPIADELRRRNVPFVFATGYSDAALPTRFKDVTRWEKPLDEGRLMADLGLLCSRLKSGRDG